MAVRAAMFSRSLNLAKSVNLTTTRKLFQTPVRSNYYVLIPEIPSDSPETNSLLRHDTVPSFQDLTPEKCKNAIGKLTIDFDAGLRRIEASLQNADNVRFEDVVEPLEKLIAPLDHAWCLVRQVFMAQHSDEMLTVYKYLHTRVQQARTQRFNSLPIYNAMKKISENNSSLDFVKQRVVNKYLIEGRLNALSLSKDGTNQYNKALSNIHLEKQKYRNNVNEATRRFKHLITDYNVVRDFPEYILRAVAEDRNNPTRGPWIITLDNFIYEEFMKHCSSRDLRYNTWLAYNTRGSNHSDNSLYNSLPIEEILFNRRDQAKLLGFSSYADLSMVTKMAGSLETVKSMISSLKIKSKSVMESDIEMLQEFAGTRGFKDKLQLWDISYWRNKYQNDISGIEERELNHFFPMDHVLNRLFNLCKFLFNITIKDETSNVEVWNSDVKFYNVYGEDDKVIGSFYMDPYARTGKRCTNSGLDNGINRCDILNMKPVAFLNFSFPTPTTSHSPTSLLTFDDVIFLMQKFGSALQHICTKVPYVEVSGLNNLEWDAVNICPYFMSFLLHNKNILRSFSRHHQTNQQLSESDCSNIIKGRQVFAAFDLNQELYLSSLDLELYSSKKAFWLDVTRNLWPDYFSFPLEKNDCHTCSFSSIFTEEYAASYFSFTWSEMIAADIFRAFEEVGFDNEAEIQVKGRRFRETFLALGGGCHPSETFRLFRGRDPSPNALLSVTGISK